jgi:hypothetical protein
VDSSRLDNLAAELTRAAHHVALQHGTSVSWLDLELDLWRALADAVKIAHVSGQAFFEGLESRLQAGKTGSSRDSNPSKKA